MSADARCGLSRRGHCVAGPARRANQVTDFSSATTRTWPDGAIESLRQKTDFPRWFNLMSHFKPFLENNPLPFFGK